MEIEVNDKELEDYLKGVENSGEKEVLIVGKGRNTYKAVDLAEELKLRGYSVSNIELNTEEIVVDDKKLRISVLKIKMVKE